MRVKYLGKINPQTGKHESTSERLSIGSHYIVLELSSSVRKGISYRIVGDNKDKSPAIFEADQFEIISDRIPKNWEVRINKIGIVNISPAAWFKEGFWEDCYDGDPVALEIYKQEARIIYDEEGEP
jgi:hypothetical protein